MAPIIGQGPYSLAHMRAAPDAFAEGMDAIEALTAQLLVDATERGADLFYAIQSGTGRVLTREESDRWEGAYARGLLKRAAARNDGDRHSHGEDLWFDDLIAWPADGLSWHDRGAGLAHARSRTAKGLLGGIDAWTELRAGTLDDVTRAVAAARGPGVIVGPGCVIPTDCPPHLLRAARDAVEDPRRTP